MVAPIYGKLTPAIITETHYNLCEKSSNIVAESQGIDTDTEVPLACYLDAINSRAAKLDDFLRFKINEFKIFSAGVTRLKPSILSASSSISEWSSRYDFLTRILLKNMPLENFELYFFQHYGELTKSFDLSEEQAKEIKDVSPEDNLYQLKLQLEKFSVWTYLRDTSEKLLGDTPSFTNNFFEDRIVDLKADIGDYVSNLTDPQKPFRMGVGDALIGWRPRIRRYEEEDFGLGLTLITQKDSDLKPGLARFTPSKEQGKDLMIEGALGQSILVQHLNLDEKPSSELENFLGAVLQKLKLHEDILHKFNQITSNP